MSKPRTALPAICPNMIVRNAAHISSWVIADTGSDDGTQELIANHMARLGTPRELCERPWPNFGHNRTEVLHLLERYSNSIPANHFGYMTCIVQKDNAIGQVKRL